MSTTVTMTGDFHTDLKNLLPRLGVYALSLTHDRDRANDLVQQTVIKSLAGRHTFRPGTNFPAWLFRIQRNEFISNLPPLRPTVDVDDAIANLASYPLPQENELIVQEFAKAFRFLPAGQREALHLSVLEGWSYEKIAEVAGVSVGTIKSRVSRGRAILKRILTDDEPAGPGVAVDTRTIGGVAVASAIVALQPTAHRNVDDTGDPQLPSREETPAFDRWLHKQLHVLYGAVASEPLPDDLIALIDRDVEANARAQ